MTRSPVKILSIIVPTYNMEALLPQCVESVLRTPSLAAVEVVIVNDGSRDGSLRIARNYERRYPDTVVVIDKPNGNYGSTVNAALPLVRGRYVRILDSDDCFEGGMIAGYIAALRKLDGTDMIVSPFSEVGRGGRVRHIDYDVYSRHPYEWMRPYDAEQIFADGRLRFFMMHSVCYRTGLLREMGYVQTEGISYTDQEWVFYPLFRVRSIAFVDIPLYRYNVAREGQTMSPAVQLRDIGHMVKLTDSMSSFFASSDKGGMSSARIGFLRETVRNRIRIILRKYLLEMPDGSFDPSAFDSVYADLRGLADRCGIGEIDLPVNRMLKTDLLVHWLATGKRYPVFVRGAFRLADRLMMRMHAAIFRR